MKPFLIFLIDDDPIFTKVLETQFREQTHYDIKSFPTGEECLKCLVEKPDIIFLDYNLNSANPKANNGLQILDKIKAANHTIPVVIISSQESIEVALNCIKHNAFEYIVKSEITFIRAKKSISILFNQVKLKKKIRFYKTTAIALSIWIVGTIISAIVSNMFYQYFFK